MKAKNEIRKKMCAERRFPAGTIHSNAKAQTPTWNMRGQQKWGTNKEKSLAC